MINSAAIAASNPALNLVPGQPGCGVAHQVGLPASKLHLLPVVYGNCLGGGGEIVPEVLDELKFLRGAQIEHRTAIDAHFTTPVEGKSEQNARNQRLDRRPRERTCQDPP